MILFAHFSLNDLTRTDLIIRMQKRTIKRDHKVQEQ
jgi:hypothetical protein